MVVDGLRSDCIQPEVQSAGVARNKGSTRPVKVWQKRYEDCYVVILVAYSERRRWTLIEFERY